MIKLATLNIWGYTDWVNRKDSIVSVINSLQPDILALQEVQTNLAFSPRPQSDFLAKCCGFSYRIFAPTYRRGQQIDRQGEETQEASYGLALLSMYPIMSSETYFLRQHTEHAETCSVLFVALNVDGARTEICNVHFGNSDLSSDLHLNELMDLCEMRKSRPIIVGDFNNFGLNGYKQTRLDGYELSTDKADYISLPKNDGTLDYIAAPSGSYSIREVICPEEYLSDHRMVLASISRRH